MKHWCKPHQEYIAKVRIEYWASSALNMCSGSLAWNASITRQVFGEVRRLLTFQAHDSPHTFNTQYRSIRYSLCSFIMYSMLVKILYIKEYSEDQFSYIPHYVYMLLVHVHYIHADTYCNITSFHELCAESNLFHA